MVEMTGKEKRVKVDELESDAYDVDTFRRHLRIFATFCTVPQKIIMMGFTIRFSLTFHPTLLKFAWNGERCFKCPNFSGSPPRVQ
jgi:hypothetical protein